MIVLTQRLYVRCNHWGNRDRFGLTTSFNRSVEHHAYQAAMSLVAHGRCYDSRSDSGGYSPLGHVALSCSDGDEIVNSPRPSVRIRSRAGLARLLEAIFGESKI